MSRLLKEWTPKEMRSLVEIYQVLGKNEIRILQLTSDLEVLMDVLERDRRLERDIAWN